MLWASYIRSAAHVALLRSPDASETTAVTLRLSRGELALPSTSEVSGCTADAAAAFMHQPPDAPGEACIESLELFAGAAMPRCGAVRVTATRHVGTSPAPGWACARVELRRAGGTEEAFTAERDEADTRQFSFSLSSDRAATKPRGPLATKSVRRRLVLPRQLLTKPLMKRCEVDGGSCRREASGSGGGSSSQKARLLLSSEHAPRPALRLMQKSELHAGGACKLKAAAEVGAGGGGRSFMGELDARSGGGEAARATIRCRVTLPWAAYRRHGEVTAEASTGSERRRRLLLTCGMWRAQTLWQGGSSAPPRARLQWRRDRAATKGGKDDGAKQTRGRWLAAAGRWSVEAGGARAARVEAHVERGVQLHQ